MRVKLSHFHIPRGAPMARALYLIRKIQEGKVYEFKARIVWKKFVSQEDCLNEYGA
jgi:hypothetical protein